MYVVDCATNDERFRQQFKSANCGDVTDELVLLVAHRGEVNRRGVHPASLGDESVNVALVALGHSAIGVWHHEHALNTKKVGGEHEGSQDVLGNSSACIAQDLHVPRFHPHDCKRIDTTVHAGDDCQTLTGKASEPRILEGPDVLTIGRKDIRKDVSWEGARGRHFGPRLGQARSSTTAQPSKRHVTYCITMQMPVSSFRWDFLARCALV